MLYLNEQERDHTSVLIDMGYLVRTQLLSNESIYNCFEYVYSFFDVPVNKEEADELDAETRRKAITIFYRSGYPL